ncbi:DMT family transporter [Thalassospira sp.]|uniref:DMT family transporter n=1 Tax=Thalassospira sp. TaxID=1912094 RepID=UPI0025D14F46|nr:DMT family transporter [Thalassospira sp.]
MLGSLWMMTAMAAFAVEDAFVKAVSGSHPVGQVLILFGIGGAVLFAIIAKVQNKRLLDPAILSRPMCIRIVFEVVGRLFYVLALALTPLSSTTAILQATPLIVVLGAAVIFGEKVGWRRWLAIFIGLIGVLIILRPSADGFSALSMFAVIGTIGFAGRDLASRAAPMSIGTAILGLYGFIAVIIAGIVFSVWDGKAFTTPDGQSLFYFAGAVMMGIFAYAALMKAMRSGDVSSVTPFRYTRLLFGLALGVFLFGEELDIPMLIGCSIVVLSGLFILWRGKKVKADATAL